MSLSVLFFSRGRGHGHAIPDMAIADELVAQRPDVEIKFASYSSGASTFRDSGRAVIDLRLPENNSFLSTMFSCMGVIEKERPCLVVAHEEFAALPAAQSCGIRAAFISAWLPMSHTIAAEALGYADRIVVIDNPGVFPVPIGVKALPCYTGPIIRNVKFTTADRLQLRAELGWSQEALCVVVAFGGADREEQNAMSDLIVSAFFALEAPKKKLIWISSNNFGKMSERFRGIRDVEVLPFQNPIERILAASDVILTKGTRGITYDAAAVGVPSISISPGTNTIDDLLVPRIRSNIPLVGAATTADILALYIAKVCQAAGGAICEPTPASESAALVATLLVSLIG